MSTTEYEVTEEDFEQLKRAAKKFGINLGDEPENECCGPETEPETEAEIKAEAKVLKRGTKKEEKKQKNRKDNIKTPESNESVPVQIAGLQDVPAPAKKEKKVREHWYKTATPEKKLESSMKARISYYMRNRGITKEEAEKVIAEIDAKKKPKPKPNPNPSPIPSPNPSPNPNPNPNPNPIPILNPELPALPVAPPPLIRARPIQVPDIPVTNPNKWKIGLRRK